MLDEASLSLWRRVCATVTKLGEPHIDFSCAALPDAKPSNFLDLHGMTVQEAFRATMEFIERPNAPRILTIVTGLSGIIGREFPHWLSQCARVSSFEQTNGGGAYTVRLRRHK